MLKTGVGHLNKKLNENTHGFLDKNIGFYRGDEKAANIPLMILNSAITKRSEEDDGINAAYQFYDAANIYG